jgi:hypothetical protein
MKEISYICFMTLKFHRRFSPEIEHEENLIQWDDYNCEIFRKKFGTSYPERPGQVPEGSGQVITAKRQL